MTRMAPAAGLGVYVSVRLLPQQCRAGLAGQASAVSAGRDGPLHVLVASVHPGGLVAGC